MAEGWRDYLKKIYFDPKEPGSFSGPIKLLRRVRKEGRYDLSLKNIKEWLKEQDTYTLHRTRRQPKKRNRVYVEGIDSQWDIDLMDMAQFASSNRGIKYILLTVDIFSKYVYLRPLKNKTGKAIEVALQDILSKGRVPKTVRSDKGKEFTNRVVEKFFKQRGIHYFTTQNETKANYAERAIKTIKNSILDT